jgi:hypothetical protein
MPTTDELSERIEELERAQRRAARNGGNNGALLARLDERMTHVYLWTSKADGRFHAIENKQDKLRADLASMEKAQVGCAARQDGRWETHETLHEGLADNKQTWIRDAISWVGLIIAGALNIEAPL